MSQQNTRVRLQKRRNQRQRRSQNGVIIVVGIAALIVVGVLIALNAPKPSTPVISRSYKEFPQDIDTTGAIGLAIGPHAAPVTLVEYSDFSCPHCRDLAPTITELIDRYVRPGNLRIVYKPVTFVGGAYSEAAARAGICAARQGKFWEMQDQIWSIFDSNGPNAFLDSNLATRARDLGLDMGLFNGCYSSIETSTAIHDVANEVASIGVTGTPTLYIDGKQFDYTGPASLIQGIQSRLPTQVPPAAPTIASTP